MAFLIEKKFSFREERWTGALGIFFFNDSIFLFYFLIIYAQLLSCVQLFATLWTVVCQAPLSMRFSRQEYWSGLPFPTPFKLFLCLLFVVALGFRCWLWVFFSCGEWGLILLWSTGSRHSSFSRCSTWAQQLWLKGSSWHMSLVALHHVESSHTRDRTRVPCLGRRILIHCSTRKVPY